MTDRGCLGEVLKELRLERGMSLRALGERAGLSPGYLSALELGRQKNPSLDALCGIAAALGVSITVSRDEPGYIRVSEGSPPCVSFVRSGVPTVREEIEEAKEESSAFHPDWVSSPGDTIADILEERGITPKELAKRADLSLGYVNRLLKGEAEITLATAIGLEVALGPTQEFWLAREANYRKALKARSEWRRGEVKRERVEEAADWRTLDSGMWKPCLTKKRIEMLTPSRSTIPDFKHILAQMEASRSWHQLYQGVPPERDQQEDWDAMKAEMDKDPEQRAMWNAAWRSAPLYGWWKALLAEMEASRSWHQLYQGVPPKRDDDRLMDKLDLVQTLKRGQLCGYIPKDAEGKVWGAIWDKVIQKPATSTNDPGPVPEDAIVASGEGLRVSEVGKWPADYKAPAGGMAEGAVAIGVDLAHGPGKAVTTVWRVQDGKVERVEDPLAKAVELLDAIRGQVVEGDSAESFKMRLAQRVAQELVDLLRWRADRVDQRTENGRRARLHNNAMVSMLAFNDDFTAWREDVMVASGKRRDPDAGKKRSE